MVRKLSLLVSLLLFPALASAQQVPPILRYNSGTEVRFVNPSVATFQGNTGGLTIIGGTASGEDLTLQSTSNGTKGQIFFGNSAYDEATNRLGIGDTTPDAELDVNQNASSTKSIIEVMGATLSGLPASTEQFDLDLNLGRTVQFINGAFSEQKAIWIRSPTYAMTAIDQHLGTAATFAMDGPPAGGTINLDNSYAFWVKSKNVSSSVGNAIGLVVEAPTGAFISNAAATFNGGAVGINTSSPKAYLDIKPTSLASSSGNTCLDGQTRYSNVYIGGTNLTSIGGGGAHMVDLDYGFSPTSNSSFASQALQARTYLGGNVNYTGAQSVLNSTIQIAGSGGTISSAIGNSAGITTISGATEAVTTARSFNATNNFSGTGTVGTYVGYDTSFTYGDVAGTETDGIGFRVGNPSKGASYTLTNFTGLDILDNTATVGTKIGIRQRGTNYHNRLNGPTSIGADAAPGGSFTLDVTGTSNFSDQITASNKGIEFTESDTNPSCASGNFNIYADLSENKLKKCMNGTTSDLDTTAAGGGNALLDGSAHTDTLAGTVVRGDVIVGNSTPKWSRLGIGAARTYLKSDGTDASWVDGPAATYNVGGSTTCGDAAVFMGTAACDATESNTTFAIPTDWIVTAMYCTQLTDTSCNTRFTLRDDGANASATVQCSITNVGKCSTTGLSTTLASGSLVSIEVEDTSATCSSTIQVGCTVVYTPS